MKVVAVIQARVGSTRLPNKVLLNLAGEPMLARCVSRVSRAPNLDEIVVATTVEQGDEAIVRLCTEFGWPYFRGSEEDVLDRYYRTAIAYNADIVVRVTSDCPLIDPEIIDRLVREFLDRQPDADYACNVLPRRTFPRGLDTEVIRLDVLERAWREDTNPLWREHVTTYIQRDPRFRIHCVVNEVDLSYMRWTVDTPEDLAFSRCVYEHFGHSRFSWHDVLSALEEHPEWLEINGRIRQKEV